MKYDLIISNPPYGSPGNNITKNIIENVDYDCFVNLLPSNDYRRFNKKFKLYQFVDMSTVKPIARGFKDAWVTTMLCRIMKTRQVFTKGHISEQDFEIESTLNEAFKKYFYENSRREHYAIDNSLYKPTFEQFSKVDVKKSLYFGYRDTNHYHLPYSDNSMTNLYNKNRIDKQYVIDRGAKSEQARGFVGDFILIIFNTEREKENITAFMYSKEGFEFMSKLFRALGRDGITSCKMFMPKVDWSRPWTPEQVLREYGYSDDEIRAALDYYLSEDEFEIENYIDDSLKKYFYETRNRNYYAFEKTDCGKHPEKWIPGKTFVIGTRNMTNRHMPYGRKCSSYRWNIEHSIDWHYFVEHHNNPRSTRKGTYEVSFYAVTFNTENEFDNFTGFIYSEEGFRFMSKVFTAVNVDGFIALSKVFPKVDWSKPQTVQSVLQDYGYTQSEIDDIIDDLKNYRYMDDVK